MKKYCLLLISSILLLLPLATKAQTSSTLLKEYFFPLTYDLGVKTDVIGLRIYSNPDNLDPFSWYQDNVAKAKNSLPAIKADGYPAVQDERSVYIQASNMTISQKKCLGGANNNQACVNNGDCSGGNCLYPFYTNIYILAYNQNASPETIQIYNQMLANIKFNKNIMKLYCLKTQYEVIKEKLRRDTIRKSDYYKISKIFENFSGQLNLQAGTYVPNTSISTWPSWLETLSSQLGTNLPVDPLNIMALNLQACKTNAECGTGQCAAGYCSACPVGWDPKTCWNERTKNYHEAAGFVYKYVSGVLTINYEYPQIQLPATPSCWLGCIKNGAFYNQGDCVVNPNQFCDGGVWKPNPCGDGIIRCNEKCDCAQSDPSCYCASDCLSCKSNAQLEGSVCIQSTNQVACSAKPVGTVWNDGTSNGLFTRSWDPITKSYQPVTKDAVYDNGSPVVDSCHYKCSENYFRNGSVCEPYSCTGTQQANSTLCPGAADGLTENLPKQFSQFCNGTKCQYTCSPDYVYRSGNCSQGKYVFVTSETFDGNLGGITGADAKCQSEATAKGLAGNYKAWIADNSSSPSTNFFQSASPYYLITGAEVAANWADLIDGTLTHEINVDINGDVVLASVGSPPTYYNYVWTNVKVDGTKVGLYDCLGWTSTSGGNEGTIGLSHKKDSTWTNEGTFGCAFSETYRKRLYCFEQ